MRARLDAANGGHGNQLIRTWDGSIFGIGPPPSIALKSFLTMDRGLSNMESDNRNVPTAQKVLDDRPAHTTDECFIGAPLTETTDASVCAATFPHYGDARLGAGESMTDNAMQCTLEPLDRSSYPVTFTDAQWSTLQQAFPDGVCDYGKPGVGQRGAIPWLTYEDRHGNVIYGGKPMGPPPRSHPIRSAGSGSARVPR